jgi:D-alanyl-D-alanine dipeptidase
VRLRAALLAFALAAGCANGPADEAIRAGFVDAAKAVPGLVVDMRYFGSENFVGRPIAGYEAPVCLLTEEAAAALAKVQANLERRGLALKVFDCYRPQRAVADFAAWARDPADQKRKADYYPSVDKSRLFELGYIAERSGHSRGSTVDVTLVDRQTGEEYDMCGRYDLFDPSSWPSAVTAGGCHLTTRLLLATAMKEGGFRPLKEEWWHFTLEDEPYPDTYFDFLVK